ncbi:MAG: Mu-like prophage major head subunit gpT family protein [Candidatus Accumulibacter sp.]|uniref:phage major capsid protein n=1 Tax=Accumulibacter sp. TaxID=2053492 RepID=UPI00258BB4DF|nr:Mu-like prophage major head subunit gpT family protein [Accumulibacter sp.]MBK8117456.1 Mu-like prophage major head subunit gpT family protein [Accumulibacter sp.]
MSGVITSSSFAKLLWPGLNAIYGKEYNDYAVEWDKLFEKNTSDKAYEEDLGLSSFGLAVVKPEGSPISYDTERQGFTSRYNHVVYALGFIITREIYEDDLYGKVGAQKAKALARSLRQTKEIVAANVYNRAFTAGYTGGDGIVLCSTAHLNVAGGTYSNKIATDADLSEAALEQAVIDIAGYRDDRGLLIAAKPEKLVIPYQLQFEAKRILNADGRVGTDLNDPNVLKQSSIFNQVIVNHYLNSTGNDDWFILTNVKDGLKYFERRGDQFEMDNDFDTENAKFKATARYSFGWSDPRGLYGSQGA